MNTQQSQRNDSISQYDFFFSFLFDFVCARYIYIYIYWWLKYIKIETTNLSVLKHGLRFANAVPKAPQYKPRNKISLSRQKQG